jgi:hypothetical protein
MILLKSLKMNGLINEGELKDIFVSIAQYLNYDDLLTIRVLNKFFYELIENNRCLNIKELENDFLYLKEKYLFFLNWYCFVKKCDFSIEIQGKNKKDELLMIHYIDDEISFESSHSLSVNLIDSFTQTLGIEMKKYCLNEINKWFNKILKEPFSKVGKIIYKIDDFVCFSDLEVRMLKDINENIFKISQSLFREFCFVFLKKWTPQEKFEGMEKHKLILEYANYCKENDSYEMKKIRSDYLNMYVDFLSDLKKMES